MTVAPAVSSNSRRRFRHALDVIGVLVDRDLKVLYKRSFLGFGWALAGPLLQAIIFTFVFRRVLAVEIANYPAYVFTGVLVWSWFQASLVQSTGLITGNRTLVRQPGFPLALLPHVTIGVRLFHFLLALPLLAAVLWWHGIAPAWSWCSLPLLIVVQFIVTAALAYPLAALNVTLRDTQHIAGALLQLLMYLTPIFYSFSILPASIRSWLELNPMVPLLAAWREVLLHGRWPDLGQVMLLLGGGCVLLYAGRRLFIHQSHRFLEEL